MSHDLCMTQVEQGQMGIDLTGRGRGLLEFRATECHRRRGEDLLRERDVNLMLTCSLTTTKKAETRNHAKFQAPCPIYPRQAMRGTGLTLTPYAASGLSAALPPHLTRPL